MAAALGSSFQW